MKNLLLLIILISLSLPASVFAQETISCTVEPYSQILKEKGSVSFSYTLSGSGDASRLSLGGLPGGVTGDFSKNETLTLQALQGAQLGSFDISLLYDVQEGGALNQAACSFNIVVQAASDRDVAQDYIPLPSHTDQKPAVVEVGTLTVEPTPEITAEPAEEGDNDAEDIFVSPLYLGIRSDEVVELQKLLKGKGYFPSWVDTTGYYGEITEKAVADFQADNNIVSVGFVGPLTRSALNSQY